MADIYRLKVYYNSTDDFSSATFLKYVYVTNDYFDFRSLGVGAIVDGNDQLTALGQQYNDNGFFNLAFPYLFTSDADNTKIFSKLSHFQYYISCGIDLKLTNLATGYMYLSTDNSDCYFAFDFIVNTSDNYSITINNPRMLYKTTGTVVNDVGVGISACSAYSGSHLDKDSLTLRFFEPALTIGGYIDDTKSYSGNYIATYTVDQPSGTQSGWKYITRNDTPYEPTDDPYADAGDSTTGGGGGSWDDGSDPVGIPSLPSVGATNTGFITLFVPTQSQLKQVAQYLWGGLFDISTYLRLFEDPMDCILGLSVVPVSVPTSGSATITVGNIELSGISLPVASQQYVEVDCGSLTVDPYFGSYLDYEPYTKMSLFVPYSGVHTVNADDLMGRTVNLVYHIDILTGSLVAFLKCGDSVLYEFNGACGSNIPVNSMNYASTIENAIRIAVNIGTTVATAGASAPITGENAAARQKAREMGTRVSLAGSTADGALSLKPNIDRAGSLGGTTGLLGNQIPYFIVTRPRLCKPKNQNKIKGYPAFINYSVSDLVGKGYTEFDTILLKNLYLTDDEKNELESILEGGVYL